MSNYNYIAKTLQGEKKTGTMEAENEHELARILHRQGCILIKADSGKKLPQKKISISIPFLNWVSLSEKIIFARNLRVMISAGVSLPRSLGILADQTENKKFKKAILRIREEIIKGRSFSESLEEHPDIFSEIFYSMIRVGEETGTMEDVLKVLVSQMEKEYEIKSKIRGAMIYPSVIILAMIGVGVLMLIVVVPRLAEVFSELNVSLPVTTRAVIAVGSFLAKFWYLPILVIFALIIFLRMFSKTKTGKIIFGGLFLKMPIISPIVKKTNSAHTVRTLSSLIASGVPIVRSLEIVSGSLKNIYYKKAIIKVAEKVRKGAKLGETLKEYEKIYPSLVFQMIEIGEETGETSNILEKLAEFYEEEVTNTTKNLSAIIEPVLMLIVGAVVGFFAVSMIQPIYGMLQTI